MSKRRRPNPEYIVYYSYQDETEPHECFSKIIGLYDSYRKACVAASDGQMMSLLDYCENKSELKKLIKQCHRKGPEKCWDLIKNIRNDFLEHGEHYYIEKHETKTDAPISLHFDYYKWKDILENPES